MMRRILIVFGTLLCVSFLSGCATDKENSSDQTKSVSSETVSCSSEKKDFVTITFMQYDCNIYNSDDELKFILYDELLSTSKREFTYGYYLSNEELDKLAITLNPNQKNIISGYFTFSPFFLDKNCLNEGEILGNTYLTEDLTVYYGIY